MSIRAFSIFIMCSFSMEGMHKAQLSKGSAATHLDQKLITSCRKILTQLRSDPDELTLQKAFYEIELLMKDFEHDAQLLILVLNKCGIVSALQKHAEKKNPYACYLASYLLQDKHKDELLLRKYLEVARERFPRAAAWLVSFETDAPKILTAIDNCLPHIREVAQKQREQILVKLRVLVMQNKPGAFLRFVRWCLAHQDTSAELVQHFAVRAKNGVSEETYQVITSLDAELRTYAEENPAVAYSVGHLYAKRAQGSSSKRKECREKALAFYLSAQKQEYLPALWGYLGVEEEKKETKTDDSLSRLALAVNKTRTFFSQEKGFHPDNLVTQVVHEAKAAIRVYEKGTATFREKELLADIYSKGIPRIIEVNEKQARAVLRDAYTKKFSEPHNDSSKFTTWCLKELRSLVTDDQEQAALKRKVLIELLQDSVTDKGNLAACAALCQIFAFSLYGIEADTNELIKVCIKAHQLLQRKTTDEITQFLSQSGLMRLIEDEQNGADTLVTGTWPQHHPVHYFIYGLICGTQRTIEPPLLTRYKAALIELERSYQNTQFYELLHVLGTIDRSVGYVEAHSEDLDTACFFVRLMANRMLRYTLGHKSSIQQKALGATCRALSANLIKNLTIHRVPFVSPTTEIEMLSTMLKDLIDRSVDQNVAVSSDIVRTYGLLQLLVGTTFLTEEFCRGIAFLGELYQDDAISRIVLETLQQYFLTKLSEQVAIVDPFTKLECYYGLVLVEERIPEDLVNGAEHFRQCLYYVRQQQVKQYEQWADQHDPVELLCNMLKVNSSNLFVLSLSLRFHFYVATHYELVAEFTTDQAKKIRLKELSAQFISQGLQAHPLLMNMVLTSEYLIGKAVPANLQIAKECFAEVKKIAESTYLTQVEKNAIVLHCRELLGAASDLQIHDQQFLSDVENLAKAQSS